ncbi:cobalt-precorrin-6A reductase [Marinobacter halodurans]|uniref:Cobalt-precorrin-6A reductase n=1 Tax=Marinobacter halodurans TaxID=2528979 RepID=A0ABY1ZG04_9GAMM|nr:cobalt-precorrin-6A reductase [Marinobacter halodurans]TBW50354.1 cobalt-precorrin-6A reductase [Marinobacter halodurans]
MKVLILGGTTEASALARVVAESGIPALFSYAGRVASPRPQPMETRVGGFGGVDGLARFLAAHGITHLVDATHPFASRMSHNAVAAADRASVHLMGLTRSPWTPIPGDRWQQVPDIEAAVDALAGPAERVMLAIGRMHLQAFARQPQHHYLLRLVDAPQAAIPLAHHTVTIDRGPFTVDGDRNLLTAHDIDRIVCKNAGGSGADAKLTAARELGLPVLMIDRPQPPPRQEVHTVDDVLAWLDHGADLGV